MQVSRLSRARSWLCCGVFATLLVAPAFAQAPPPIPAERAAPIPEQPGSVSSGNVQPHQEPPPVATQLDELRRSVTRITLATALASVLALRPRRRGTPRRQPHIVQTQMLIAAVGATA